jgi:hypothetical protein
MSQAETGKMPASNIPVLSGCHPVSAQINTVLPGWLLSDLKENPWIEELGNLGVGGGMTSGDGARRGGEAKRRAGRFEFGRLNENIGKADQEVWEMAA